MMSCKEIKSCLEGYFSGLLSDKKKACVKTHLRDCPSCSAEFSRMKNMMDLVLRKGTPNPSVEFWQDFDKELGQKLDAVDRQKYRERLSFVEKIKDAFRLLFRPGLRSAVVTVCLIIMIVGVTLFFADYQGIQLRSIAGLSDEELVDELVMIERITAEASSAGERTEGANGVLSELELLYELDPSLFNITEG